MKPTTTTITRASLMMQVGAMLQMQAGQRVRNFETKIPEKELRSEEMRMELISASQQKRERRSYKRRRDFISAHQNNPLARDSCIVVEKTVAS